MNGYGRTVHPFDIHDLFDIPSLPLLSLGSVPHLVLPTIVDSQGSGEHGGRDFGDEEDDLGRDILRGIFRLEELWAYYVPKRERAGDESISCDTGAQFQYRSLP